MEFVARSSVTGCFVRTFGGLLLVAGLLPLLISCSPPVATPASDLNSEPLASPAVATGTAPAGNVPPALGGTATVVAQPATVVAPPATEVAVTEPAPAAPRIVEHTVQPGDTLLGLALQYQVPMAALQMRNGLGAETDLLAGQVLEIPASADWPGASPFWVVYLVPQGATLIGIASLYDLDLATLRAVNSLADVDVLRVGQSLILPLDGPAEVVRAPDPTPTAVPPTTAPPPTAAAPEPDSAVAKVPESPPPPTSPPVPSDVAAWPEEVFRLINAVRAAHGLPPYVYNAALAQAAQLHGQDCQERGWCGHTGSDGSNVRTRIQRVGYDAAGGAECIVYSTSPQAAVDWWMDEVPPNDAHRRTLLSTWVTEIGIAVVPRRRGVYYFIADFGRPN